MPRARPGHPRYPRGTMIRTRGYAAFDATSPLRPMDLDRRDPGPRDVLIDIAYCGICHSDLHTVRGEWGPQPYPFVPGHEIVGKVARVGAEVTKLRAGELAGVGCMVDSCRTCEPCRRDLQMFCEKGAAWTYASKEMDKKTPTNGGYSRQIVVDEAFALRLGTPSNLAAVAPLLCAGITTWSPLRQWKVGPGSRVGVVGLGGLGHVGVKLAASLGAEVTLLSSSPGKEPDARRLGAHAFVLTSDAAAMKGLAGRLDLILDTVSAPHDLNRLLGLLRVEGTLCLVGLPPEAAPIRAGTLVGGRRRLTGSLIGGIAETQEMLDHCAKHGIVADIELLPVAEVNRAYERLARNDVRYRFVLDLSGL